MYDSVEVSWVRGHDPEIQIHQCDGVPPSQRGNAVALKTLSLSTYTHEELHWMLQCEGFSYLNATAAKVAAVAGKQVPSPQLAPSVACEALVAVDAKRWWRMVTIGGAVLITCVIVLRCALKGPLAS